MRVLTELRIEYLRDDCGVLEAEQERYICVQLEDYFARELGRNFFAVLGECGGEAISAAYLAVGEKPANPAFITGKVGTIMNVYTKPQYRRRGLATKALKLLIDRARKENLSKIELSATEMGCPLYEKLGFEERRSQYTQMQMRLV